MTRQQTPDPKRRTPTTPAIRTIPLPPAPKTRSPVPWLTSIHGTRSRGPYGKSRYSGNCGGYLIKDLLRYFRPRHVLDPMSGSGTCPDVCRHLRIPCTSFDIRTGQDAGDARSYEGTEPFDFIWLHPPYWRMMRYGDDPRCLSNAPTLDDFLNRLRLVIRNCRNALTPRGHLALLIGGYTDRGRYLPLPYLAMGLAIDERLWPACTDIVRFQHGSTASRKTYDSSFIPGLHDVCLILKRA